MITLRIAMRCAVLWTILHGTEVAAQEIVLEEIDAPPRSIDRARFKRSVETYLRELAPRWITSDELADRGGATPALRVRFEWTHDQLHVTVSANKAGSSDYTLTIPPRPSADFYRAVSIKLRTHIRAAKRSPAPKAAAAGKNPVDDIDDSLPLLDDADAVDVLRVSGFAGPAFGYGPWVVTPAFAAEIAWELSSWAQGADVSYRFQSLDREKVRSNTWRFTAMLGRALRFDGYERVTLYVGVAPGLRLVTVPQSGFSALDGFVAAHANAYVRVSDRIDGVLGADLDAFLTNTPIPGASGRFAVSGRFAPTLRVGLGTRF